jgi:hypothetical protein
MTREASKTIPFLFKETFAKVARRFCRRGHRQCESIGIKQHPLLEKESFAKVV